uniref:hypothetical protein n=1 Tax=Maledivibacter halophilus TaxID=36842 RepID=UPI0038B706B5
MSNKYSNFNSGLVVSNTAMLLVPLLTYLPIFLFQSLILATIVASGLWAYIRTTLSKLYLYILEAKVKKFFHSSLFLIILEVILS